MHDANGGIEHSHVVHLSVFNLSPSFIVSLPNLHFANSLVVFVLSIPDAGKMISSSEARNLEKNKNKMSEMHLIK